MQDDPDLEILVSDNSAGDAEAAVRSFSDSRIHYIRPPKFMVMSDHWEFVLGNASGDCVCFIGDDDGLMPGAIAALRAVYGRVGNVPIHHPMANYCWPDHPDASVRNTVRFIHPPVLQDGWQASPAFLAGIASGQAVYLEGPAIYHNFLPMPLIRQIAQGGQFFRRPIPDVWSALAVAANSTRFYTSARRLTLAGQAARSNGALVNAGKSDGTTFAPPSNPLLTPRFNSRGVAMLTLDSLLEVQKHWPDALADIPIEIGQFLRSGLSEARQMRSKDARHREIRAVVNAAVTHHQALGLVSHVARRGLAKLAAAAGLSRSAPPPLPSLALKLGADVADIHGAAIALAAHLGITAPAAAA